MWIKSLGNTTSLYVEDLMDEPLEFTSNGTAQVKKDVGEQLIERYPGIVEHGNEVEEMVPPDEDEEDLEEVVEDVGDSVDEL